MLIEFVNIRPDIRKLWIGHTYKTKVNSMLLTANAYIRIDSIYKRPNHGTYIKYQYVNIDGTICDRAPFDRNMHEVENAIDKEIVL